MIRLPGRRTILGASIAALLPLPAVAGTDQAGAIDGNGPVTLLVGDQRGATRSILKSAGQLDGLPYRVQWAFFPVGAPLVTAIAAGALDFGYVGDATAIFAFAGERPLRVITVWKMDGASCALVVPRGSTARTMRDLIGRRIAFVKGSPGHLLVLAALKREGLTPDQIIATPLSAANARTALTSGSIDAWAIWDPFIATVEREDQARILLTAHGLVDEVECGVANQGAITGKRGELLDFLARVNRALAWGNTHREERARGFSQDSGVPIEVARLTSSRLHVMPLNHVTDEAIAIHQRVANLYQSAGVIPSPIDVARFYDRSFVIPA